MVVNYVLQFYCCAVVNETCDHKTDVLPPKMTILSIIIP